MIESQTAIFVLFTVGACVANVRREVTENNCVKEGRKFGISYKKSPCVRCYCSEDGREVCYKEECKTHCPGGPFRQQKHHCCGICIQERSVAEKPRISLSGTESVEKGDAIRLSCVFRGEDYSQSDVDWFKDGEELSDGELLIKTQRSSDAGHLNSTLVIQQADVDDGGVYICIIGNSFVVDLEVTVIDRPVTPEPNRPVTPEPNISLSGTKFVEHGGEIKLLCVFAGEDFSPSDVHWVKEGEELSGGEISIKTRRLPDTGHLSSTFVNKNVNFNDSGKYVCIVSDSFIADFEVTVTDYPVTSQPSDENAPPQDRSYTTLEVTELSTEVMIGESATGTGVVKGHGSYVLPIVVTLITSTV